MFYVTASVHQEFRRGLAGSYEWLRVFQEAAVEMLAGAADL